jgi:hypothetical protein
VESSEESRQVLVAVLLCQLEEQHPAQILHLTLAELLKLHLDPPHNRPVARFQSAPPMEAPLAQPDLVASWSSLLVPPPSRPLDLSPLRLAQMSVLPVTLLVEAVRLPSPLDLQLMLAREQSLLQLELLLPLMAAT